MVALFSWVGEFAQFLGRLFVPEANYFYDQLNDINGLINSRFGGFADLFLILHDFLENLKLASSRSLVFSVPDGFLFAGYKGISVDLFSSAAPYLAFMRNFLNGCLVLYTVVVCYHKLRLFFDR